MIRADTIGFSCAALLGVAAFSFSAHAQSPSAEWQARVESHAAANGVPAALVHRVIMRESGYRPGLVGSGGAMGLMQIKLATARGMGYSGSAAGLLDPETNMTYAVRYLAGAYRVAGGNVDRAVSNYARGYYYAAKERGLTPALAAQTRQQETYQPFGLAAAAPLVRSRTYYARGSRIDARRGAMLSRHHHRHSRHHRHG